ncbi:MAG TPA: serine hydrolase domain-containing protein [Actinomycetota bacterium]|nr:serine hydrolase domain-containing protein [Actinomycetota bacterium]
MGDRPLLMNLQSRLTELCKQQQVPGAALGVLHDGDVTAVATGVINLNTGVETTPDTLFQIGSITKPWTATVVMQLVEEGLVSLDEPVRTYLPGFKVADPDVSERVTLRHLLSHTSGIDGDHFEDTGRGDDCLERYVDSCATLVQLHPLGATMSYCNTGFSVAGRIIEVITGKLWDDVMRERLFAPLGLTHTCTLPEEALLFRTAAGHIKYKPDEPFRLTPVWRLPRATGPMGAVNASVADALTFAKLHMDGGTTPDGKQLLSAQSVVQMQTPQIAIPNPHGLGNHWGVGWILFDWDDHRLYGHDGNSIGQHARLKVAPDANLAVVLLTNGGYTDNVERALFTEIFEELAGITIPIPPQPPSMPPALDLSKYAGVFERLSVRIELAPQDGRLVGTAETTGSLAEIEPDPVQKITLTPVDQATFIVQAEGDPTTEHVAFYDFVDGVPQYLHSHSRAYPRVQ